MISWKSRSMTAEYRTRWTWRRKHQMEIMGLLFYLGLTGQTVSYHWSGYSACCKKNTDSVQLVGPNGMNLLKEKRGN